MRYIIFAFFSMTLTGFSQVMNVETLRREADSTKWSGSVSVDLSLIKNTNTIYRIANKAHVQYRDSTNLWLLINDMDFQKTEDNPLVNRGYQHLRYNRTLSPNIKLEAFAQAQYDAISEIDFRGLLGMGPRFKLIKKKNHKFYLGTLIMYEYEKASNVVDNRIQEDIRASCYLSFSIYPTEAISIISTSYYQPKLESFRDFRISSNTSLLFKVFKNLAFKTNFSYNYDAFPVSTAIPETQFELTNGVLYSF